jgi:uncharacterized protein
MGRTEHVMKIAVKELSEGTNHFAFDVPAERFDQWVHEADDLYHGVGEPCSVKIDVDRYDDLLTIRGHASGPLRYECARCLAERTGRYDADLRWTLVPMRVVSGGDVRPEEEQELSADDLDVSFYAGEEFDVEELLRETILLELEPCPRCPVDECEGDRYLSAPSETDEVFETDGRWAALAALRDQKKH